MAAGLTVVVAVVVLAVLAATAAAAEEEVERDPQATGSFLFVLFIGKEGDMVCICWEERAYRIKYLALTAAGGGGENCPWGRTSLHIALA